MRGHDWPQGRDRHHLEAMTRALAREFAGVYSVETVDRYVDDTLDRWSAARIQTYLPVLVHRFVRERLRALGQAEGKMSKDVPEVLFVCVHNAGRSQMAAGLLDRFAEGRVHVRSAGSTPADEINAAALTAMAEIGIDLTQEFPKPLTDEVVAAADVVITMGCGDACPIFPGKRYLDWEVSDPAGRSLEEVRGIRDDIAGRVRQLIDELIPAPTA
jgi:protein-tyrosine-phosphatase